MGSLEILLKYERLASKDIIMNYLYVSVRKLSYKSAALKDS